MFKRKVTSVPQAIKVLEGIVVSLGVAVNDSMNSAAILEDQLTIERANYERGERILKKLSEILE